MLFSRDADTVPDMAEEEVKLTRRVQLFVGDVSSADEAPVGELSITTRRVAFTPAVTTARGFSLYYHAIMMHAVSRDTSGSFARPCIYLQLDGEHRLDLAAAAPPAAATNGDAAPMDISGVEAADDDDDEEEDEESQEVRIVPLDPEPDGGMDPALDALFEALSACAALNPDPGDEGGEEEDEEEEDEFDDPEDDDGAVVGLSGADAQQALLAAASPDQLAMLARYDALLEESETAAAVGTMAVADNSDGRYDDPDDDEPSKPA